jgi:hypothetical protein
MASKMSWHHDFAKSAPVVVYWLPEERDWRTGAVRKALGDNATGKPVDLRASEAETAEWTAAAAAYVEEVAAAKLELAPVARRTRRWRRTAPTRGWAQTRLDLST